MRERARRVLTYCVSPWLVHGCVRRQFATWLEDDGIPAAGFVERANALQDCGVDLTCPETEGPPRTRRAHRNGIVGRAATCTVSEG